MRAELAGEANPISGRMRVVKVRGFAIEALAAVFLFKGPIGQADVGLSGSFAFFEWIHTFSVPQNLNGRVGGGGEGRIDAPRTGRGKSNDQMWSSRPGGKPELELDLPERRTLNKGMRLARIVH